MAGCVEENPHRSRGGKIFFLRKPDRYVGIAGRYDMGGNSYVSCGHRRRLDYRRHRLHGADGAVYIEV